MRRDHRLAVVAGAATVLAALSLAPVFAESGWFPYVLSAVAAVVGAGVLLRVARAPLWLQPPGMALALLLYLGGFFGTGPLPTPDSLRALGQLAGAGFGDIAELAAPVPADPGLVLLTVAGVGAVAILVDLLAVGYRRAALAGLPLLGLYLVPVAVQAQSVGWLWFALGVLGYLWLLRADGAAAVRAWGRPFRPGGQAVTGPGAPTGGTGFALASVALVAAIALPALLPNLSPAGLFSTGEGAGFGRGGGRDVRAINPITRLKGELQQPDNVELLRVRTTDPDPFYLRLTTLDVFRPGDGWSQSALAAGRDQRVARGVPRDPGLGRDVPGRDQTTVVDVAGLTNSRYLPVYAGLVEVAAEGDWRYEPRTQTVFSVRAQTRGLRYSFVSFAADFRPELLAAAEPLPADDPVSLRFGGVPPDPAVQSIVDEIVAGKTTPYERAVALNAYFSPANGFRYSLATKQGNSGDDLLDFLRNKQGYCEQYASALAYLARRAGLPARVAIGFTRGDRRDDHWSVATRDAHAWVEIYFAGVGWVPFDPTPLGGAGHAVELPWTQPAAAPADGPAAGPAPSGTTSPSGDGGSANAKADQLDRAASRESAGTLPPLAVSSEPAGASPWPGIAALVAVVLVLTAPALARPVVRRRRLGTVARGEPRVAAHAAWDEVIGTLLDLRIPVDAAETPRATAARIIGLAGLDSAAETALRRLAAAEERARYAATAEPADGLADAVGTVGRALTASSGRAAATRAVLVPASVLEATSAWLAVTGAHASERLRQWPRPLPR